MMLKSTLEKYFNQRVFFEPVGGNHGDKLIEMGASHFLSDYNFIYVDHPCQADLIIVNGSGSFAVELWSPGLTGLKHIMMNYPAYPVIVLPSSYDFLQTDFVSCFVHRTAPVYLFVREPGSFARIANLQYPSPVFTHLHRDMAFELHDSPFLSNLKKTSGSKHILLIERFDREATTQAALKMNISNPVQHAIPDPVKRLLKKWLHFLRRKKSGFTPSALKRLYSEFPEFLGLPVIAQDISSTVGYSFEQFIQLISEAAVVISNRLHAAILAAMLNKTTIVLSGHPYSKLEGCYEYSLKDFPNVYLW